ncbi:hypothetical protein CTEN210_17880 [Chaetoceros tenuissimus]|uniref:Uncharacterized protein n=1 Tax=Chaetoceros tenuissimus TaxID=426638 RepID=A0AAD3DBH8_9STRA|nr:hypothetical protein CTEN210_17880 [Chaetoceros tenuissimus]
MDHLGDEDPFYLPPSLNQSDIAETEHSIHSSTFHDDDHHDWDALHNTNGKDRERARIEEELKNISADLERTKNEAEQANAHMFGQNVAFKPFHYEHASSYTATTVPIETASVGSSSRHFDMSSLRNSANYIIQETHAYSDSNVMQPQTIRSAGYAASASSCTGGWTPNGNASPTLREFQRIDEFAPTSNHSHYDHGAASVISESINSEKGTYHLQQNWQNIDNFQRARRRGSNDVSIYSEPGIMRNYRGPGSRYAHSEISDCGKRSIASLDYDFNMQPDRTIKRRASEVGGMKQEFAVKEAEPAEDPVGSYEYYNLPGRDRNDDDDEEDDIISCGDLDDLEGLDVKNFDWDADHKNVDHAKKELSSHSMPNGAFTYGENLSTFSSFGGNSFPLSFSGAQEDTYQSSRKIELDMTSCKSAPVFAARLETHKESSEDEDNYVESLGDDFLISSDNYEHQVESKPDKVYSLSSVQQEEKQNNKNTTNKKATSKPTVDEASPKPKITRKKKVGDDPIEELALNPEGNDADDRMVYKSELKTGGLNNIGTQFCKYTMREFTKTEFGQGDLIGKRRGLEPGYPGLMCAHCCGKERRLGGRYFPSTIKTLSDTKKSLLTFYSHLLKCNEFPAEKKLKLKEYHKTHEIERESQSYGSQKKFFVVVWHRLHKDYIFNKKGKTK